MLPMGTPATARSRRERPAKPALTLPGIVATAIAIVEEEDFGRLTMRRLAAALDTGPASLYVYVRNTAELHAYVLEEMLGTLDLSWDPAETPWRQRLGDLLTSYTELLLQHRGLAGSTVVLRPSGANYLDLVEAILRLLTTGGVPGDRAAWGVDLLLQTATAVAVEHGERDAGSADDAGEASSADDDGAAAQAAAVHHTSASRHPLVTSLATDLLGGTAPERVRWAFDVLVSGMLVTPTPTANRTAP